MLVQETPGIILAMPITTPFKINTKLILLINYMLNLTPNLAHLPG